MIGKRLLVTTLAVGLILSLAACGTRDKLENKITEDDNTSTSTSTSEAVNKDDTEKKEEDTDSIEAPAELESRIADIISKIANGEDIMALVVNYDTIEDKVYEEVYYDAALLLNSINKDEKLSILTKSDEVKVGNKTKKSKSLWEIELSNEIGDRKTVEFIKINDEWKLNINDLVSYAYFGVAGGVPITLNNKEVPVDYIEVKDVGALYRVPGVLKGVTNTVKHDNSLGGQFTGEVVSGAEEAPQLRYELTEEEVNTMLPEIDKLWKTIKEAAEKEDVAAIQNCLADSSKLDANIIMSGLKGDNYGLELVSFTKRLDSVAIKEPNVCYMRSKDTFTFNLLGSFTMTNDTFKGSTPTEYCSVEIEKVDGGIKLINASGDCWTTELNAFSKVKE